MFKRILFDLDGTLTDPKIGITTCVQHALRHFGIEEEIDNLTKFIGPPLVDSFMEFYGLTREDALIATDVYRERFAPIGKFENEVYDGIKEMLAELKAAGILLGVASSKPEVFVIDILKHFDLFEYFDVIVGSLMNETRTKKEEVLEEAFNRLSIVPVDENSSLEYKDKLKSENAMVGDRKFDVVGAKTFGLTAVGVAYGYAEPGELEAESPDFIAGTVDELRDFLLK